MKKILIFLFILIHLLCVLLLPGVKNPDKPLKGDWDLKAEKQWQTSKYVKKPMAISMIGCISDDGTICLYDFKYTMHFVLDSAGVFKAEFGRRGEGPGEIRFPGRFFAVKDKFIIYDYPKLQYFLIGGDYIKSIPIGGRFDPPEFFINEDEYISFKERGSAGIFSHVNLTTGKQNILKKSLPSDGEMRESTQQGIVTVIIPGLSPQFKTAFDAQNKRIYYGKSDEYVFDVCDMEGKPVTKFSLEREKIKFTKDMLNKYVGVERRMLKQRYKKIVSKFPYLTYFQKIQVENGLVLVYVVYLGEAWEEQQIDIFSLDGRYLYRVLFRPDGGERIVGEVFIKDGYLYTIQEDSGGDRALFKYKIALPVL